MSVIFEAAAKAQHWHKGQMYGEHNYMYHLIQVAEMVERMGGSPNTVALAYLHDIVEDTDIHMSELWQSFEVEIVLAVLAITKMPGQDYSDYIAKVRANPLALLTKKADTLCNLTQSLIEGSKTRVNKYTTQLQLLVA